jgi:Mrp family chromosome partitioning ATPase
MLLFVALLVVREGRMAARLPGAALEKLGLTVLTPSQAGAGFPAGSDAGGGAARVFRRIAMRVRDRVADAGPVILFSSVNGGPEAQRLAFHVSRLLGTSDARVLILDVRSQAAGDGESHANVPLLTAAAAPDVSEKSQGALTVAKFLDTASAGLEEVLQPTSSAFVDYLHAGPAADPDFLASRQMADLLKAVAEKYAHVVVLAPPICESLGAESLASWANVVVLSAREGGGTPSGAEAAVRSLQEGEAPVFVACCD